ncbi:MAG: hypothetical protein WD688_02895 [Candidatus Binatia bacterium]
MDNLNVDISLSSAKNHFVFLEDESYTYCRIVIENTALLDRLFGEEKFDGVMHFASFIHFPSSDKQGHTLMSIESAD